MGEVVSLQACEGCGTRENVLVLLVGGLSQISGRAHPLCRECAGHIGPVTDEDWERMKAPKGAEGGE